MIACWTSSMQLLCFFVCNEKRVSGAAEEQEADGQKPVMGCRAVGYRSCVYLQAGGCQWISLFLGIYWFHSDQRYLSTMPCITKNSLVLNTKYLCCLLIGFFLFHSSVDNDQALTGNRPRPLASCDSVISLDLMMNWGKEILDSPGIFLFISSRGGLLKQRSYTSKQNLASMQTRLQHCTSCQIIHQPEASWLTSKDKIISTRTRQT